MPERVTISISEAKQRFERLLPRLVAEASPQRRRAVESRLRERFKQYLFQRNLEQALENFTDEPAE